MKQNKIKSTIGIIVIGMMSIAILAGAYLLVYPPVRINSQTQAWQTNQQAAADGGNVLTGTTNTGSSGTVTRATTASNKMPVFDAKSLKAYDGKNGQPAYIAFEGTVYEVGQLANWVGGFHHGYQAGQDLTEAFANSPHTKSIFKRAIVVGTYSDMPLNDQAVATTNHTNATTAATSTETITLVENTAASTSYALTVKKDTVSTKKADTLPTFNADTLSAYNGKKGQPAYVAIDGKVYDVGAIVNWVGGFHHGYQAGKDLTKAFASSPHTKSILSKAKLVGYYNDSPATTNKNTDSKTAVTQSAKADTKSTNNKSSDKIQTNKAQDNKSKDNAKNSNNQLPVMTLKELSKYNGKNGNSAYVAVNGIIYDVTGYWSKGKHNGLTAGSDVTKGFAGSPHSQSLLNSLPIVGILSTATDQQKSDALKNAQIGSGNNNASFDDNDGKYNDDNDSDRDDNDGDDDGDHGDSDDD